MFNLNLAIGTVGMVLILVAFVGDLFKKITEDYAIYNIVNIIGALALAFYAYSLNSAPFLILQLVWAACSAYKLLLIYREAPAAINKKIRQ